MRSVVVVALTVVVVAYLLWRALIVILESKRWPEPNVKPFWCSKCSHGFRSGAMYSAHLTAQHHERFGPFKAQLDAIAAAREQDICPKCDLKHASRHDQLLCPGPQRQRVALKLVK